MPITPDMIDGGSVAKVAVKADGVEKLAAKTQVVGPPPTDINGDGVLTVDDCPFPHGTVEAKKWFYESLKPSLANGITPEMKAKYGDKVTGAYGSEPLVPGVKGSAAEPQGDFKLMSDRIRLTQGVDKILADKITAKMMYQKYPKAVTPEG
jgi:hypothetical protein